MEQKKTSPNIKLGQYKGLKIVRHVRPVEEKTVEQELVHQARSHAVYHPSAQPAKPGSRVTLDFEGFFGDQPIPDSKMEKVTVCLGTGKLMPDAEKAICGHCAGEVFRFDFTYPADFRLPELAGKTAQFEINLHSVAEKQTPAVSEAFAQSLGYASLDEMRAAIRKSKAAIHEANADRKAGADLLEMAGMNSTVALSPIALDKLAANDMAQLEKKLKRSNLTLEQHCARNHTTSEALKKDLYLKAERRVRSVLAAKAIAEAEHITVSTAEVNNEYHRLAQLHGTPEEEIRKVLSPESIAASIAAHKVEEFLLANADVTTVTDNKE